MRVVAGSARGLRLDAPEGRATRPTSDRVREAVFNALGSLDAIEGATVLDLFAGSGALGIEALSRGAAQATFVESDAAAIECITANLARCGLSDRAVVRRVPVERFLALPTGGGRADLVVVDPPYAFDDWTVLSRQIAEHTAARWLVAESDRAPALAPAWRTLRERRYGGTVVCIASANTAAAAGPAPDDPQESP